MRARVGRRVVAAGIAAFCVLGLVVPPAHAFHGIGLIKISNPSNGSFTSIDGEGFYHPRSGLRASRGDVLKVKTWELKPNATYALWIIWPDAAFEGVTCRFANAQTGRIMENALKPGMNLISMKTNAFGQLDRNLSTSAIEAYKAVVPDDPRAAEGTAEICAREVTPVREDTTSQHVRFTIVA